MCGSEAIRRDSFTGSELSYRPAKSASFAILRKYFQFRVMSRRCLKHGGDH